MKAEVYHAIFPTFSEQVQKMDEYELVAIVDVTDNSDRDMLEEVFYLTNHVDGDWTDGSKVEVKKEGGCRSTSVGDIVVIEGRHYLCQGMGWKQIFNTV
jgi:hypothetical protein